MPPCRASILEASCDSSELFRRTVFVSPSAGLPVNDPVQNIIREDSWLVVGSSPTMRSLSSISRTGLRPPLPMPPARSLSSTSCSVSNSTPHAFSSGGREESIDGGAYCCICGFWLCMSATLIGSKNAIRWPPRRTYWSNANIAVSAICFGWISKTAEISSGTLFTSMPSSTTSYVRFSSLMTIHAGFGRALPCIIAIGLS